MSSLDYVHVVSYSVKDILLLQGTTPMGRKFFLLARVLLTFYKDRSHVGASFSFFFLTNSHMTGLAPILIETYMNHRGKRETWMM